MFYLFLRERQSMSKGETERERGRHRITSKVQAPSCQHSVNIEPDGGLEPTSGDIMT